MLCVTNLISIPAAPTLCLIQPALLATSSPPACLPTAGTRVAVGERLAQGGRELSAEELVRANKVWSCIPSVDKRYEIIKR